MNGWDINAKAWTEEERLAWIAGEEKKAAEAKAKEAADIARKAAKRGMTVVAYVAEQEEKAAERTRKAKIARYTREIAEMEAAIARKKAWLEVNA